MRGVNTASLALDGVGTQVPIANNTMNFVTGHVIAVNDTGVVFTNKLETAVYCDGGGNVTVMSTMETVIKDDIPQVKLDQLFQLVLQIDFHTQQLELYY